MKRVIFLLFFVMSVSMVVFLGNGTKMVGNAYGGALTAEPSHGPGAVLRPDQITIEAMTQFGKTERPLVVFPHDTHTDALEGTPNGCKTCHLEKQGKRANKFMRLKDTSREALLKIYHDNCIGCHQKRKDADQAAGPVECGRCHTGKIFTGSSRVAMEMDTNLHYRHSQAYKNKCENCHHEYNETTRKLFYAKGKEGSCRYCHTSKTEGNRISMRLAAHEACVNCHLDRVSKKKESGPTQCAGCHEAAKRKKIKQVANVKRIERQQPDIVLIHTEDKNAKVRMALVPFDHKAHEVKQGSCRTCHHKAISACTDCHTVSGDKKGNYVPLEQAMHNLTADQSCLGCHAKAKQDKNCSGCHAPMRKSMTAESKTCEQCHMPLQPGMTPPDLKAADETVAFAKMMLESRSGMNGIINIDDVPETVTIKGLANNYKPAKVPHRKVFKTLQKGTQDNQLAKYFHRNAETLCQGCHHNAPATMKPTGCVNCHPKAAMVKDSVKPGLLAAYHQQCMDCHKNMRLRKPADCIECHAEAKK